MFIDYKIGRQSRLPGHARWEGGGRDKTATKWQKIMKLMIKIDVAVI